MHQLLIRQLKRYLKDIPTTEPEWLDFFNAVSESYEQYEQEQHSIEQALAVSTSELTTTNQELRVMFNSIPDMYFRVNSLDRVLSYKAVEFSPLLHTGHQPGQHLAQIFSVNAYQQLIPVILDARRTQQPQHCEIQIHQTDALGIFDTRIFPILDNDLLVLIADISQRKLQEYSLQQAYDRIAHQNRVLVSLTEQIEASIDSAQMLRNICTACAQALGIAKVGIWLFQENADYLECEVEYDSPYKRFNQGQIEARNMHSAHYNSLRQSRSMAFNDAFHEFAPNKRARAYLEEHNILSLIHAPLRSESSFIGILRAYETRTSHEWTPDEQQFVASIADLISMIFQQQKRERVITALDESEVRFKSLAQSTDTSIFAFRGAIVYANGAMEKMSGFSEIALKLLPISVVMGEQFAEQFSKTALAEAEENYRRRLEIEFTNRSGEVRWAFVSVAATLFEGKPTWLASAFDITERKRAEVQLRYQAFHDPLTGLPNRTGFIAQVDQCLLKASRDRYYKFALLYLDLDRFKLINDNLGHMFGDELLIEIALRLRKLSQFTEVVARLGGDEFAILIENIQSSDDAILMAERILNEVRKPFLSEGQTLLPTASIGITLGDRHSEKAEHLLRNADVAMYQAKARGKNRYAIYDGLMHAKAQQVIDIERDLRQRLYNNNFALAFTPIVNVQSAVTVGFTVHMQWHGNSHSDFTDDDYRALATDSGLIGPIEDWMIEAVGEQLNNFNHPYLYFIIKIGGKSLCDLGALKRINVLLERFSHRVGLLQIECSETQLVQALEPQLNSLENLKRLQCSLVLDNFGVGQSSIPILSQLPIKALKIDEAIVQNYADNQPIIKAIVNMGKGLGLEVIAKGVNNISQLDALRKMGCTFAQGKLFANAVDAQTALGYIDKPWRI